MDLYNLNLSKSAQFYKVKKRITKTKVNEIFKKISESSVGYPLFKITKEVLSTTTEQVICSAIAFRELSEPPFLTGTPIEEEKYCFVLLIECRDCIAITKRNVPFVEKALDEYLEEFDYERFTNFQGRNSPEYEKVTMNNMAISNAVIKSRSYEAFKLNGLLASNSSSRSIPQNFRIRVQGDTITLTPNSSRVTFRDKKSGIEGFSNWVISTIEEINNLANASKFISEFAEPITLSEIIKKKIDPAAIFINLDELDEIIRGSSGTSKLRITDGSTERDCTPEEISRLFNLFKYSIGVNKAKQLQLKGSELPARITLNKKQVTFHSRVCDKIFIEINGQPSVSISKYINNTKPISMMFNSPQYAYFGRSCFQDKRLIPSLSSILSIFDEKYDFTGVNSEKEKQHKKGVKPFPDHISEFPTASLFRKIEDNYCKLPGITICDDMNDEWADHIYLESDSNPPAITFIHAKFTKKDSHGASSFHEVVAQGLKNIGRVFSTLEDFKEKHDRDWNKNYENTKISRVRGGKVWNDLEKALTKIFENQNSTRKIVLATPFISKNQLKEIFLKLSDSGECKPHHTQLIWLINTFIGTCKDLGVQPHILCKP
ncbi:hypothetical protein [Pseudomonas syringae]|uniref:Uncharacterized protein n=1 Tax=Pseudomonas syringae pv. syringae TaxID=321 RepID=A0AAE5S5S8_PSESY|nr:hypothetical protein [Pseudomonas syringae]PHN51015.1 hypothetical protein AO254_14305 [Pseudomonas syringae]POQ02299.1 hypothetical protein CXB42_19035 [Pseudomonas syringae pv. syringae]